jgi:hypothetical protein
MDRNNPVWREYLKGIVRIQIDAGVDGIQLDEAELPLTTLQYGGCFCKDCMKGFRAYLQGLPLDQRPNELEGTDLSRFHYGEWLLAQGYDFKTNQAASPLFSHYLRFQRRAITQYFGEIADYAREYAASKGRSVLVSGNFFNLLDQYYALEPKVDLIITEMRTTRYKQPTWYRYVAGFAGPKPVVVVENPYGGVVPELVEKLNAGKGHDLFRMSLYEAAALGANMTVPYGAWLGSVEHVSFWAPHALCTEIQTFLADHEHLFSRDTYSEVAVVYSIESNLRRVTSPEQFVDHQRLADRQRDLPFWEACDALSDAIQPYDVVFFPEGELRADTLTADDLNQYRTLILPACTFLTETQADLIDTHLVRGGRILALGEIGSNLPETRQRAIADHRNTVRLADRATFEVDSLIVEPQIKVDQPANLAINLQRVERGLAIHIIRYEYDVERDQTPILPELSFEVRLPQRFGNVSASVHAKGLRHRCRSMGMFIV